jgi:hypothetical protein
MKARWMVGMLSALLVLSVSMASAQGGGRRGQLGGGGIQLLRNADVQKELKMTQAQIDKIDAKQQELRQAQRDAFGGGNPQDLSAEDRQKAMAKIQEAQKKALTDILDATQLKRYHQLELQQQGPLALTRKEVAEELKLTDEQKTKITDIQRQVTEETRAARQGVNFQQLSAEEREKLTKKTQEIQKAAGEKVVALLTDEQKKKWTEMQGEIVKFPLTVPPQRRA